MAECAVFGSIFFEYDVFYDYAMDWIWDEHSTRGYGSDLWIFGRALPTWDYGKSREKELVFIQLNKNV